MMGKSMKKKYDVFHKEISARVVLIVKNSYPRNIKDLITFQYKKASLKGPYSIKYSNSC